VAKKIPLDRLVLETDSPHFSPRGNIHHNMEVSVVDSVVSYITCIPSSQSLPERKNFSLPIHVANVAGQVAVLKGVQLEEVIQASRENVRRIYRV
jgi:Tat protein secretion system quality control protein TatD with DNase activity